MPRSTTADPRKPSAAATTLAERLLKAREDAGFAGREEAAQASGGDISRQNLAGWELGRNLPGYRAIHRLCKLYGVSADWLLGLD
jgi:transcriptional regulator with XRE-family HTH domain